MTTPVEHRRNAIQDTAKALAETWETLHNGERVLMDSAATALAEAAYTAIVADMRRAFAEEAAQAIQEQHNALDPGDVWENEGRSYLATAIDKIRETGGIA